MPVPASYAISIDVNAYRKKEHAARKEDRIAAPLPRWHLTARKQFYFPHNLKVRMCTQGKKGSTMGPSKHPFRKTLAITDM